MRRINHSSRFIEQFGGNEKTLPLSEWIGTTFPGEWGTDDIDGTGVKVIRTTNFTNAGKLDLTNVVTRDIETGKVKKKQLKPGDIVLERSGGTADNPVGRVVYFEAEGIYLFNNFTQLLRCKDGVNSLYVFYSLFNYYQTHKNEIRSMGNKTTGIQNLKMDKYWEIPIVDASSESQEEFVSLYRQADKSKFSDFKSRFIEQFGTPHNAEWPLLSFAEFASIDAQMTDDFEAYADSPHIGIDSIEQNTGKILNYRTVSEDSVKSGKYIFTRNHIIYSKIRPNLNKVAEPDFDGLCSADAYPLLAKEKVCKKRFLAIILRSDDFLSYIVPLSNRTGMPKANREQLEGYSFRMPPVDIQDAFLSIVEQADKSKYLN